LAIGGWLGVSGGLDATGVGAPVGILIGIGVVVVVGVLWLNNNGPGDTISPVRGGKRLKANPAAEGDHCTFRPGHRASWRLNPNAPANGNGKFQPGERWDGQGPPHGGVPPPHIHVPGVGLPNPAGPNDPIQ
jgi:hypothetical protein